MSITREEATVQIYGLKKYCEDMADSDESGSYVFDLDVQALDLALTALRPVSREQVEKMWKGCEYCSGDVDNRSYLDSKRLYLDKNGILTDEIENIDILRLNFCPVCGKPLTDEAVDIMLKRMEALLND